MNYAELKRRLRRLGMELDQQRTRHELWVNPRTGARTSVPRHTRQEIPPGTLHSILQRLGISREAFEGS